MADKPEQPNDGSSRRRPRRSGPGSGRTPRAGTVPSSERHADPTLPAAEPTQRPTMPDDEPERTVAARPRASSRQHRLLLTDESEKATVPAVDAAVNVRASTPRLLVEASGFAKFRLGESLGKGGMGIVRAAEDIALRRTLAIKTLIRDDSKQWAAKFVEEAQITGQLEHPNIVPVHELGLDPEGRPYLAMKRVQGKTLKDVLERDRNAGRPLTPERLGDWLNTFHKVCDAIAYAHARQVIHRDLKPENVMVGSFGEVLVMDWGLAKPLTGTRRTSRRDSQRGRVAKSAVPISSHRRETAATHTMQGSVMGTPAFMAPEQARGDIDEIDQRADIYALGGILYQILTLTTPREGDSLQQVLLRAVEGYVVAPRQRAPQRRIPKGLEAIVLKAMSANRRDRYARVEDLQADLRAFEAHLPMQALRDGGVQRAAKWLRRHPVVAATGSMAALFVLALGLVVSLWMTHAAEQQRYAESQERMAAEARHNEEAAQRLAAEEAQQRAEAQRLAETEARHAAEARQREEAAQRRAAEEARRRSEEEAARILAEQQEREAHLAMLAQEERIHELLDELNVQVQQERGPVLLEIDRRWREAESRGKDWHQFVLSLDEQDARRFVEALTRAVDAHRRHGDGIAVTPTDYGLLGALLGFRLGERTQALSLLEEAAKAEADNPNWPVIAGRIEYDAGRFAEARRAYDEALTRDPQNFAAWVNRAATNIRLEEYEQAERDATEALALDPRSASAYSNRGVARIVLGELALAEADFDSAIQLRHPDVFPTDHYYRAAARVNLRKLDEALEDLDISLEHDPTQVAAWQLRAQAYSIKQQWTESLADWDRVVELEPQRWQAWEQRGRILHQLEQRDQAVQSIESALQHAPPTERRRLEQLRAEIARR